MQVTKRSTDQALQGLKKREALTCVNSICATVLMNIDMDVNNPSWLVSTSLFQNGCIYEIHL